MRAREAADPAVAASPRRSTGTDLFDTEWVMQVEEDTRVQLQGQVCDKHISYGILVMAY